MNTYWFDIEVAGPVTEEHTEALADRLTTRGGIDATVQADHRGGAVISPARPTTPSRPSCPPSRPSKRPG